MDNIRRGNILKEIKNANRFEDDVYLLVEEDLTFGLEKDQIDLYLKKNFKLSQMKVLSSYLRKGICGTGCKSSRIDRISGAGCFGFLSKGCSHSNNRKLGWK